MHSYGPHRPEDAPATVTVLEDRKWPLEIQVPIAPVLLRQRKAMNTIAYLQAVARG